MAFNVIGKTVMKSLFSKPATAMYPVIKNEFYPNTRGSIEMDPKDCIYCNICGKRCPATAIEVSRPERKWSIDRTRCIVCNYCVQICPKNSLSTDRQYTSPMTDKEQRLIVIFGPPAEEKPKKEAVSKAEKPVIPKAEKSETDA